MHKDAITTALLLKYSNMPTALVMLLHGDDNFSEEEFNALYNYAEEHHSEILDLLKPIRINGDHNEMD